MNSDILNLPNMRASKLNDYGSHYRILAQSNAGLTVCPHCGPTISMATGHNTKSLWTPLTDKLVDDEHVVVNLDLPSLYELKGLWRASRQN